MRTRTSSQAGGAFTILVGLVMAVSVATLTWAGRADAAGPTASAEVSRARELNASAVSAYVDGRFEEAARTLDEAISLAPSEPVLYLNLGKAHEALRDRPRAILAYEKYLSLQPAARERRVLESRIATLRAEVEELEARKRQEQERSREPAGAAIAPPPPPPPPARSVWPYVLIGVGAAGLGAAVVTGVVAVGHHDDAVGAPNALAAKDSQDTAKDLALVANVTGAVGIVVLAVGTVWAIVRRSEAAHAPGVARAGAWLLEGTF